MASRPPAIFLLLALPLLCYVVSIEAYTLPDDIPEPIWLSDEVVPESSFVTTDTGSSNCITDTGGTCRGVFGMDGHCDDSRQARCDSDKKCVCNPDQCAVAGKCVVNPSASPAEKAKSTDTGGTCGTGILGSSSCDSSRGAKCVGNKCICKQGHAVSGKCVEEDGQTPGGIQFNEDLYTCWAQTPTEEEAKNTEAINTDMLCFTGSPERPPQGSPGQFSPTHGFPHEYKGTVYDTSKSCRAACPACQGGECFESASIMHGHGDRQYYQSCGGLLDGCGHGLSCDSREQCVPYKTEGEACGSSAGEVACGHDLWCSDQKMKALNTMKGTSDKQLQKRCTKSEWKGSFLSAINWGDVADVVMVVGFVVSVVATGGAALVVDGAVDGAVDVTVDATADAAEDEGAEITSDETANSASKTVKLFKLADKIGHTLNKLCDYGKKLEAAYDCIECIRSNCTGIEGEVTATYKALDTFKTSLENSDSTKFNLTKQLVLAVPAVMKLIKTPKLMSDVQHIDTCSTCWKPCKKLK